MKLTCLRSTLTRLTILLSVFVSSINLAHSPLAQTRPQKTFVGVIAGDPPVMSIDALVLLENGKLKQPYDVENLAARNEFGNQFFKKGNTYRVTFGGGEVGTASIIEFNEGCNNIHAQANGGHEKIRGRIMGLVTNDDRLGRRPSHRRAPTADERAAVMELVKQIYTSRKTTPAMLRLLTTTNLTATDLNGDGKSELIGSFVIETAAKARRDLLLIAEPEVATTGLDALSSSPKFRAALVEFQSYKLPPEEFHSAIDFVDYLDLDRDGTGEVFTIQQGFDAYEYSIYKKQSGRWQKVYSFIGDAC